MKVVFLQDVPNVAKAGEIKEVAAGYGRNFLIPRKLAALASPQAMSQVETTGRTETEENAELVELAAQLEGKEVSLKAKAGAKERIYGSITSADIAAELKSTTGIEVDKRKIELDEPIRQLGSYEVSIRLAKDILPKIKVNVTEEEKPKAEKKPAKKKAAKEKAPAEAKKTTKKAEKAPKAEKKTTKKVEKKPAKKATAKKEEKPKAEKKPARKAKTTKKEEKAKA
jgi:large subunit ribosomal protein L9